jgi:hypothetical protein
MRYLLAVACLALASSLPASPPDGAAAPGGTASPPPSRRGETAWLCRSKFFGLIFWGKLSHSSVAVCPKGESPVVFGENGWVSNPRCRFCGTQPLHWGFQPEEQRLDVEYVPALVPVETVKERICKDRRFWLLWRTCHAAAQEATGWPEWPGAPSGGWWSRLWAWLRGSNRQAAPGPRPTCEPPLCSLK